MLQTPFWAECWGPERRWVGWHGAWRATSSEMKGYEVISRLAVSQTNTVNTFI